ncbi:2OG-Fe(II) oxygenase [Shewanella sp. KT0246]|uniref:2OG-Fe(II) oxygenase n=1 Tax=Shewanella sp. KT0246 TaxID=2815912 RepID=UPI001BBD23E1|nr:2OG-Fe(II) oxygenase [Shewanella sp. KT0246]GIU54215.1 hypothetical protein TUM4249_38560 [Shewanella sp. KT0246]
MKPNELESEYKSGSLQAGFHLALYFLRSDREKFDKWINISLNHELKVAWDFMSSYEKQTDKLPKFIRERLGTSGFAEYYLATQEFKPTKEGYVQFAQLISISLKKNCQIALELNKAINTNFQIDITKPDELLTLFNSYYFKYKNLVSEEGINYFSGVFNNHLSKLIFEELNIYLQPSLVLDPISNQPRLSEHRTAYSAQWLPSTLGFLGILFDKLTTQLAGKECAFGEPMTLLQYKVGQEYKPHFDFINERDNEYLDGQQRIKTILVGLNFSPYSGGDTNFPSKNLKFNLMSGDILVFDNASKDGKLIKDSLHQSTPVTSGTKFIISKWVRQSATRYDIEKRRIFSD